MKFNVRIASYGVACLLIIYLGNVFIGMSESLPESIIEEPIRIVKRDHLDPFNEEAYHSRLLKASSVKDEIHSILDLLIEKGKIHKDAVFLYKIRRPMRFFLR